MTYNTGNAIDSYWSSLNSQLLHLQVSYKRRKALPHSNQNHLAQLNHNIDLINLRTASWPALRLFLEHVQGSGGTHRRFHPIPPPQRADPHLVSLLFWHRKDEKERGGSNSEGSKHKDKKAVKRLRSMKVETDWRDCCGWGERDIMARRRSRSWITSAMRDGHRKICVPPAVACEHWVHPAATEIRKMSAPRWLRLVTHWIGYP